MTINASRNDARTIRVALIGAGLMAKSHSLAYASIPALFPDLGAVPELSILADVDDDRARAGAESLGFARWTSDWREAVSADDIDVVDIVTPNALHFDMAMAAIAAGKHVYCEKPLALTAEQAKTMYDAARDAGVKTIVGFSYLGNPGIQLARKLINDGTLGDIWSIDAHFLVDANADARLPRTWHYERAKAGLGALGDIGSHVISIVHALGGPIDSVIGTLETVVKERPEAIGALSYGSSAAPDARLLPVENDDVARVLARLRSGATATISASRVANGHPFNLGFEVTGGKGSIRFSQQDSYKVQLFLRGEQPKEFTGTTEVHLGPLHGDYAAYWPFPGVTLGLHELKAVEIRNFMRAILDDEEAYPAFREGWHVVEVLDATDRSNTDKTWTTVNY